MSTVTKEIAQKAIDNNGHYHPEDPEIIAVIEYSNIFNGDLAYKLVYKGQDIEQTQGRIACRWSKLYWSK